MKNLSAFSLVEVAITTTVIGIIASLTIVGIGHVVETTKREKLFSDVETLNRGVLAYRASGGDLSTVEDPNNVLDALKQTSSKKAPGLTGSKIDPRIVFVFQNEKETSSDSSRVYWNASSQSFKIATSGSTPGIKGFEFSAEAGEKDYGSSDGNHAMLYAEEDDWIWDYQEVPPTTPAGPSDFAVTPVPNTTTPPTPPTSLPPVTPSSKLPLAPPIFSIPSSSFPFTSFDLAVFLSNPNPPGVSEIYYSVDYGNWVPYSGSVIVPPDANVAAQAVAVNDTYSNSARVDQGYKATPVPLLSPVIIPERSTLGLFTGRNSQITIASPNDTTLSRIEYQVNGGGWQTYNGKFLIKRNDYPDGAAIIARAVPVGTPYYTASPSSSSSLAVEPIQISGNAKGNFSDPTGGSNLVTNLASGNQSDHFAWGRDYYTQAEINAAGGGNNLETLSQSTLDYKKVIFSSITTGNAFEMGELNYYNGTIRSGTGADSITLSVDLNLDVNGTTAMSTFDFKFGLINVANKNDPKDPWADADYVKLSNPVANETILINGVEFKLKLEFGETSKDGVALFDEFHVLESKSAKTTLYGTLVEVGSIGDDSTLIDTLSNTLGSGVTLVTGVGL